MTNDKYPMTNGGAARKARRSRTWRKSDPQLVICHWDLVIPVITCERIRE
jgi:hypothetical protein